MSIDPRRTLARRTRPHSVYRLFDASGHLLYVGCTSGLTQRLRKHKSSKAWWPDVARCVEEVHPNFRSAQAAERDAIASEHPLHNVSLKDVAS